MAGSIHIGCAGWSLPKQHHDLFATAGTHLQRYASRFNAVEINSSFYRPHKLSTYERWAQSTPAEFRFAVKVPREITHKKRLRDSLPDLEAFLAEIAGLGEKCGPILVQLPPSLKFDDETARDFFVELRSRYTDAVVCEPRHASWFEAEAESLLKEYAIARAVADPPPHASAVEAGGDPGLVYYRLHGSPKVYYSEYAADFLDHLAERLRNTAQIARDVWCVFDNTALGYAVTNALELKAKL